MARHPPSGTWGFVDAQFLFEEYELCVGGIWVGYHGQLQATYSRRIWLLLWLLILIAGDNSRRTSQRPRNESMGLTGKTCGWGKSRITDERAIFHPMTRVWTTYRVGNSESMDARALPLPNREIERPNGHFNGLGVLRQVDRIGEHWPTPKEHHAFWRGMT